MTTYPCYYFSELKTKKNIAMKKMYKVVILNYTPNNFVDFRFNYSNLFC